MHPISLERHIEGQYIVPNKSSEIGIRNVEIIIVRIASLRFRPAISISAGLAKTDPAVVVASRIIVTIVGASRTTQNTVMIAGTMNICHETIVHVNVSILPRIAAGLSSSVFSEKTTTKNNAIKMNGKHASANAGNISPIPMATAIKRDDQDRSLEDDSLEINLNPHC
jgi:hypothetical protein